MEIFNLVAQIATQIDRLYYIEHFHFLKRRKYKKVINELFNSIYEISLFELANFILTLDYDSRYKINDNEIFECREICHTFLETILKDENDNEYYVFYNAAENCFCVSNDKGRYNYYETNNSNLITNKFSKVSAELYKLFYAIIEDYIWEIAIAPLYLRRKEKGMR